MCHAGADPGSLQGGWLLALNYAGACVVGVSSNGTPSSTTLHTKDQMKVGG